MTLEDIGTEDDSDEKDDDNNDQNNDDDDDNEIFSITIMKMIREAPF